MFRKVQFIITSEKSCGELFVIIVIRSLENTMILFICSGVLMQYSDKVKIIKLLTNVLNFKTKGRLNMQLSLL